MKTITTGPNTRSTLSLRAITFNEALERIEIVYRITTATIDPDTKLANKDYTAYVRNTPAVAAVPPVLDHEGNEERPGKPATPAGTAYTDFCEAIASHTNLQELAEEKALEDAARKGLFTPHLDDTADTWRNQPIHDSEPAPQWTTGERVMAGMVRTHQGVKSRALTTHTTSYEMEPGKSDAWGAPGVYRDTFLKRLKNLF